MDGKKPKVPEAARYGKDTLRKFQDIRKWSVHINRGKRPRKGRLLKFFFVRNNPEEDEATLANKCGRSRDLYMEIAQEYPQKKALAEALGITESAISNGLHARGFSRNQILSILMLKRERPDWQETNRRLMQFGEAALSNSEREGKRNRLIGFAFDTASELLIGDADYLGLLQIALREMGLEPTVGRKRSIPSKPALREEEHQLIIYWKTYAVAEQQPRTLDFRLELLDRYCVKNELLTESVHSGPDRAKAYDKIVAWMTDANEWRSKSEDRMLFPAPPSKSAMMKYFQKKSFRVGTREDLIWVFSAMGISLEEMNRVLSEADYAVLYPDSALETEQLLIRLFSKGGSNHE